MNLPCKFSKCNSKLQFSAVRITCDFSVHHSITIYLTFFQFVKMCCILEVEVSSFSMSPSLNEIYISSRIVSASVISSQSFFKVFIYFQVEILNNCPKVLCQYVSFISGFLITIQRIQFPQYCFGIFICHHVKYVSE